MRLYPEVYGPAVSLGWAPARRDYHLREDGEILSRGNLIIKTRSSPIRPLQSHSLVCNKKHLFIVGIGRIRDEEI